MKFAFWRKKEPAKIDTFIGVRLAETGKVDTRVLGNDAKGILVCWTAMTMKVSKETGYPVEVLAAGLPGAVQTYQEAAE